MKFNPKKFIRLLYIPNLKHQNKNEISQIKLFRAVFIPLSSRCQQVTDGFCSDHNRLSVDGVEPLFETIQLSVHIFSQINRRATLPTWSAKPEFTQFERLRPSIITRRCACLIIRFNLCA